MIQMQSLLADDGYARRTGRLLIPSRRFFYEYRNKHGSDGATPSNMILQLVYEFLFFTTLVLILLRCNKFLFFIPSPCISIERKNFNFLRFLLELF